MQKVRRPVLMNGLIYLIGRFWLANSVYNISPVSFSDIVSTQWLLHNSLQSLPSASLPIVQAFPEAITNQ